MSVAITVRLAPSFAAKWLSTRLEDFRRQYPDIDFVLNHSNAAADFAREDIDLAVTYGQGDWRDVVADPVLSLDFFPVCCPAYMEGETSLTNPDNLRHYTLLHDADDQNRSDWLHTAALPNVRGHDLRHAFGHRLRAAGVSSEDRQDLLGHKSERNDDALLCT